MSTAALISVNALLHFSSLPIFLLDHLIRHLELHILASRRGDLSPGLGAQTWPLIFARKPRKGTYFVMMLQGGMVS